MPTPPGTSAAITAQFTMPWFMGASFIPKFGGDKTKYLEWRAQVEAMLRAQGLNDAQQADFVLTALEGEAKQEVQLLNSEDKDTGKKILDFLQELYSKPVTKAQLRANFYNCRQRTDENVNVFILRLREMFSRWREQDEAVAGDTNSLLLDQLMIGLRKGPVKQELCRLLRRDSNLTFVSACKEARALEQELDEEGEDILSQRVRTQAPLTPTYADSEQLKGQIRAELKEELMGEVRKEIIEQIKTLSSTLVEEVRAQLASPNQAQTWKPTSPARQHRPSPRPSFQWDTRGRPICQHCGAAGHIQRRCPQKLPQPQGF